MEAPPFYSSKTSENATAFVNGRIYTIDESNPWAEAFIISPDGEFEAVGSNDEILSIAKKRKLVQYQLRGKSIMRGIHDAHTHLLAAGCQRLGEAHLGWYHTIAFSSTPPGCVNWASTTRSKILLEVPIVADLTTPLSYAKTVIEFAISECHRYGITSVQEASANTAYLHAVNELEAENRLPMDISRHIISAPEALAGEREESLAALLSVAEAFKAKHVHTDFVKFFLDGAPLPPHPTQCDLNDHGEPGPERILLDFDYLLERVPKYDARNMTCKIHVAGEGSAPRARDVYEAVRKQNPNRPKHELAHCNAIHPDDLPRIARLGLTAEMSPAMWHYPIAEATPKLLRWAFNDILASGAHMTIGSDWILTPNPSLFDPLAHLVERLEVPNSTAQEDINKKQAACAALCRIITLRGAEAVGRSSSVGSIEVGKMANFIAIDRDLSEGEFAGATVLKTWFEGRQVYNSVSGQVGL